MLEKLILRYGAIKHFVQHLYTFFNIATSDNKFMQNSLFTSYTYQLFSLPYFYE